MTAPLLPPPRTAGTGSLEAALAGRRSRREFTGAPLSPADLGQLLWAAHGVTGPKGRRTAPTAGNTLPHEVYAVVPGGAFRYDGAAHRLEAVAAEDVRTALVTAYGGDETILKAGAIIVLAAVVARTAARYPDRWERYVAMGLGHTAQNVLLQAEALGLAAYPVGAHDVERVAALLGLPEGWLPLYMVPVGHPAPA